MAVKKMGIEEFVAKGFLQEANRQFFHPLGLALEVTETEDGQLRLSGVWDCRDEPEGIVFTDLTSQESLRKAVDVVTERDRHAASRAVLLRGVCTGIIQPLGSRFDAASE